MWVLRRSYFKLVNTRQKALAQINLYKRKFASVYQRTQTKEAWRVCCSSFFSCIQVHVRTNATQSYEVSVKQYEHFSPEHKLVHKYLYKNPKLQPLDFPRAHKQCEYHPRHRHQLSAQRQERNIYMFFLCTWNYLESQITKIFVLTMATIYMVVRSICVEAMFSSPTVVLS